MSILKIIEFIKNETRENEKELLLAYDAIKNMLDSEQKIIDNQITKLISDRNYEKVNLYVEMSEIVSETINYITELGTKYDLRKENSEENILTKDRDGVRILEEPDFVNGNDLRIDYDEYKVDESIAYELSTDFCHMKPAAFALDGIRYEARSWKVVLVKTCQLLWKKKPEVFAEFLNDETMQGTKRKYFSKTKVGMKKPELISGTRIYIETNQSANNIRDIIIKMLKKYGISQSGYQVYLSKNLKMSHDYESSEQNIITDNIIEEPESNKQELHDSFQLEMQDYCTSYDYKTQKCMNEKSPHFVMECCKKISCAYIQKATISVRDKSVLKKGTCPKCGKFMEKSVFLVKINDNQGILQKKLNGHWCTQCEKAYINADIYKTFMANKDSKQVNVNFVVEEPDM